MDQFLLSNFVAHFVLLKIYLEIPHPHCISYTYEDVSFETSFMKNYKKFSIILFYKPLAKHINK